jgi:uncharacterized paraquat-inducible protein A
MSLKKNTMQLISCPACQSPVSDIAPSCPKCGHPIAGNKTEATTGLSALAVIAGIILTGFLAFKLIGSMQNLVLACAISVLPTLAALIYASMRKK